MTTTADKGSPVRLSVAMIVRDEADVLSGSIESVRPIADEIVVLDTGSTDQTPEIAQRLGAVVARMPWNYDFADARNHCLQRATGDWVLWLDAAEQLDAESAAELREFVDRQADATKAYMLLIEAPPVEPGASRDQVFQRRLVPNHPNLQFLGRVRETLRPSIEAAGLQPDTAVGRIVGDARQHHPVRQMLAAKRNLELVAMEMAEVGGPPPTRLMLAKGEACNVLGVRDDAREAFQRAIESARRGSTEMLEAYYGLLSSYDGDQFLGELQLSTCLEALEIFPFDSQLLLAAGDYLQKKNHVGLAVRAFETAVNYGQVDLEVWHPAELAEIAADCLSLALQIQKRDDEAQRVLQEALQRNESSVRLRRRLIELCVKHGRCDEALALAGRLPAQREGREPLRDAIRGACEAARQQWTPALGRLQSAYVSGCRDPICLRWLSVTLLSNGQVEAARPVLREWHQVEPDNAELQSYLAATGQREQAGEAGKGTDVGRWSEELAGRHFRVDEGTTVLRAAPPIFPIISQTTSADSTAGAE